MTDLNMRFARLAEIDRWFGDRGFGIILSRDDEGYWAHLFPKRSLEVTVPRYGRGTTPEEAAESAQYRYVVEEA